MWTGIASLAHLLLWRLNYVSQEEENIAASGREDRGRETGGGGETRRKITCELVKLESQGDIVGNLQPQQSAEATERVRR